MLENMHHNKAYQLNLSNSKIEDAKLLNKLKKTIMSTELIETQPKK